MHSGDLLDHNFYIILRDITTYQRFTNSKFLCKFVNPLMGGSYGIR